MKFYSKQNLDDFMKEEEKKQDYLRKEQERKQRKSLTKRISEYITSKQISIAKLIIYIAMLVAFLILVEDFIYVVSSDGLWSILGQKLIISFVALVALIAMVNGKIGIDTQWLHDKHIGLNDDLLMLLASLIAIPVLITLFIFIILYIVT